MYRQKLAGECRDVVCLAGAYSAMYVMKNTGIPLSIAFVDRRGKIFNIYDLQPYQRRSVCSKRAAQYALEVNQGWFSKNNIRVGDVIDVRSIKK